MRNALGYILGFLLFVVGIPALMWWVSGRPFPWAPTLPWAIFAVEDVFLTFQVRAEEKRLESDFSDEYLEYKKRVPRYLIK